MVETRSFHKVGHGGSDDQLSQTKTVDRLLPAAPRYPARYKRYTLRVHALLSVTIPTLWLDGLGFHCLFLSSVLLSQQCISLCCARSWTTNRRFVRCFLLLSHITRQDSLNSFELLLFLFKTGSYYLFNTSLSNHFG